MNRSLLLAAGLLLGSCLPAFAQQRVAVLPFRNMDGRMQYDEWRQRLSEALIGSLSQQDGAGSTFSVIPADSINAVLATLNLDPNHTQYETDLWKAIETLHADRVVMGTFNVQNEKLLINTYVVETSTKLPNAQYQAKNLFKAPETAMETIPVITRKILPALAAQ